MTKKKLDQVFVAIDALMRVEAWDFLNELFLTWSQQAWRTDIRKLVAIATVSLPAKDRIPNRAMFMETCMRLHTNTKLWKGLQ